MRLQHGEKKEGENGYGTAVSSLRPIRLICPYQDLLSVFLHFILPHGAFGELHSPTGHELSFTWDWFLIKEKTQNCFLKGPHQLPHSHLFPDLHNDFLM